jgi:hypothetical protein
MTIDRAPTRGKLIKVGQLRSTLVDLVNVTSYKFGVVYDPPIPCSTPGFMREGAIHSGAGHWKFQQTPLMRTCLGRF